MSTDAVIDAVVPPRPLARVLALISLLHEPFDYHSATRLFANRPVLAGTLERVVACSRVTDISILCWDEQADAATDVAVQFGAEVVAKGPYRHVPQIESIAAARRWSDGWRGGLLQTVAYDAGFHATWFAEACVPVDAEAVVLIPPTSVLLEPSYIDQLIELAEHRPNAEWTFTPTAPGIAGLVLTRQQVKSLASIQAHPGRLFAYRPEAPRRDPIAQDFCLHAPARLTRTTQRLTIDSDRQARSVSLGVLSSAEEAIESLETRTQVDPMPRDVTLELNTSRATTPQFLPALERPPLPLEHARTLFAELGKVDDVLLTLGGLGDPLLHPQFDEMLAVARRAGVRAIHVETDLLPPDSSLLESLARHGVDVVSVSIPAMTQPTYASIMGVDRIRDVLENVKQLLLLRAKLNFGTPIVVPTFAKCDANLAEMESWYDHWLRAWARLRSLGRATSAARSPTSAWPRCARRHARLADGSPRASRCCATALSSLARMTSAACDRWGRSGTRQSVKHSPGQCNPCATITPPVGLPATRCARNARTGIAREGEDDECARCHPRTRW
ncbi:MAG: radical SAM protein [Tepidisphaeraceae bacterium]